ncbi:MAG TPA: hypothetical protein VF620_07845 [Allosphingosinicella sp.]
MKGLHGFGFGLLVLGGAALPAGALAAPACRISLEASADGSFAEAGYDSSPARLGPLVALTRDRFAAAARRLCAAGVLRPTDLERLRKLVVQNGEGATEPLVYRDEATPQGSYILQYAFQGGGPPERAAFEQALRCWKRPQSPGCDFGD